MSKKRRTRKQKAQAAQRRHNSYSTAINKSKSIKDVSINVEKSTTKIYSITEHKSLVMSVGTFIVLIIIQLIISWWIAG
ncbi:MAG: hypothetical protein WDZ81_00410 [Candidatus Saccharimonadales bacterium]